MYCTDVLFNQLDQSPTQKTQNFEYDILEAEMRSLVQQRTNEIKTLMRRNIQDIIDIGQKLIEVKQHLKHGNFRNWVKLEFNWSVSTATKFMQVAEQFKCVNFKHLKINASTLYLIAAPSTPKAARIEVLERASNGESITYTEARTIVSQHKKTKKGLVELKIASLDHTPVNVIEPTDCETHRAFCMQEDLIDNQIIITIKEIPDDATQTVASAEKNTSDAAINEMAISIKNLMPEELAEVIIKAANNGLSQSHLSAIIMACQQVLNTQ